MSSKKSVTDIFTIGARLRFFRKGKNLTQQELAESIGLSQNFLSAVESDKESLSKPVLLLLENLYRINQKWLLEGVGPIYLEGAELIAEKGVPYGDVRDKIMELLNDMDEEGRQHIFNHTKATQSLIKKLKEG